MMKKNITNPGKIIQERLMAVANPEVLPALARLGIVTNDSMGVRVPVIRKAVRGLGRSHEGALWLWDTGYRESRIAATLLEIPTAVTTDQLDRWLMESGSWDVVDACCANLFWRVPEATSRIPVWCQSDQEMVVRGGYVLMACLAIHAMVQAETAFSSWLPLLQRGAKDERKLIRKAIAWVIREMGSRSKKIHGSLVDFGQELQQSTDAPSRRMGKSITRELHGPTILAKLDRYK